MRGLRARGRLIIAAIALLVTIGGLSAPSAAAAWQTTASAPAFSLQTGSLTAPPLVSCETVSVNGLSAARITWTRVAGANDYAIIATNPLVGSPPVITTVSDSGHPGSTFSVTLQGGLLNGVLVLLSGNPSIAAVARNGSWTSSPSTAQTVLPGSGLGFLVGGSRCP